VRARRRTALISNRTFNKRTVAIGDRFAHVPVRLREPSVGAWPNFYLGLAELLMREPDADAYLMVQDDAIFYDREDLSTYLGRTLWPAEPMGAVSLFRFVDFVKFASDEDDSEKVGFPDVARP
jgi:hypothetical protein